MLMIVLLILQLGHSTGLGWGMIDDNVFCVLGVKSVSKIKVGSKIRVTDDRMEIMAPRQLLNGSHHCI